MYDSKMKIALIVNHTKAEAEEYAEEVLSLLREAGAEASRYSTENYTRSCLLDKDCVITLGGDGTILRAARKLAGAAVPILGINVGHLGFLAEVAGKAQIPSALHALLSGNYYRDVRSMLRAELFRNGRVVGGGLALNEVLLSRRAGISILRFLLSCDGQELARYSADGILVSTPTGSTAYNLSAGGPILSPTSPVYVMTPICAHTLNGRPVVMDDKRRLEILAESDNQLLSLDGEKAQEIRKGDLLRIRRAEESVVLVKIREESFLQILRDKMSSV